MKERQINVKQPTEIYGGLKNVRSAARFTCREIFAFYLPCGLRRCVWLLHVHVHVAVFSLGTRVSSIPYNGLITT